MNTLRLHLLAGLIACLWVTLAKGNDPLSLQDYMSRLQLIAEQEGDIPLAEYGSGSFAEGVCKAQNLAEQQRFSDAASLLSSLIKEDTASDWRSMLETRIQILNKWSESGMTEIDDYRLFYLETGPSWFHKRTKPIVTLWQSNQFPDDEKKYFLLADLLAKKEDAQGQALVLLAIPQLTAADESLKAEALLAAGNVFYGSGDYVNAGKAWLSIPHTPQTTPSWAKAVFNMGIMEKDQKNYSQAVRYFEKVLAARPNDMEAGGHIMEVYRNYSHRSSLEISNCYEQMGEYRQSLHYALLARNQYPYRSWCGTCSSSQNRAANKRIGYLAMRSYGAWAAVIVSSLIGIKIHRMKKNAKVEVGPKGS